MTKIIRPRVFVNGNKHIDEIYQDGKLVGLYYCERIGCKLTRIEMRI